MRLFAERALCSVAMLAVSLMVLGGGAEAQNAGRAVNANAGRAAAKKPAKSNKANAAAAAAGKVSDEQAVAKVMLIPEVKAFWEQGQLPANKKMGTAKIEVEPGDGDDKGSWIVHVYTLMSDHTATMGWYRVDRRTGAVSSMMP